MSGVLTHYALPCLWAFLSCLGFCVIFNIRSVPGMLICCTGGALGWLVYLLAGAAGTGDVLAALWAGVAISAWSEAMARLRKCPVTGYLLVAFFPLVPGGGIYYAMEHAVRGEAALFAQRLMHTVSVAGALALGVLLVSSAVRMWRTLRERRRRHGPPV